MLKSLQAAIVVALFALIALLSSPVWLPALHEPKGQSEASYPGQKGNQPEPGWEDPVALSTLGLVIVTFILAAATISLARSTGKAARAAEKAAQHIPTVERAWVFGSPWFEEKTVSGIVPHHLTIKNHGKTPGTIKVVCVETIPNEPFDPVPSYQAPPEQTEIVLSAGDSHIDHRKFISINPEYLVGYIRYVDIFDNRYVRRFCFRVLQSERRFTMAGHPNWNKEDTEKPE